MVKDKNMAGLSFAILFVSLFFEKSILMIRQCVIGEKCRLVGLNIPEMRNKGMYKK